MQNTKNLHKFLIELIRYANEEDIDTFLHFLGYSNEFDELAFQYDMTSIEKLINNALFPILGIFTYKFDKPNIKIKYRIGSIADTFLKRILPDYVIFHNSYNLFYPLYLHLYAICECYYSYIDILEKDNSILQLFANEFTEFYDAEQIKIKAFTKANKTNIIRDIINNYEENGFYYYFTNNKLVKLEIVDYVKNRQSTLDIKETEYVLEDKDDITNIIDKVTGKSYKVRLHKQVEIKDNKEFNEQFSEEIDYPLYRFIQFLHKSFVKTLIECSKEYCKCCNPNLNSPDARALCDNCKNLFEELDFIKEELKGCYNEDNDFGKTEFDYKKFLYDIKFDSSKNYKKVRQKRKHKLLAELNKIDKKIESSNYFITKDRHDKIKNSINVIRDNLISKSFDY